MKGTIGCEKTAGKEFARLPEGPHFSWEGVKRVKELPENNGRFQVDFVLDSNKEWLHVAEVMKRCQRCSSPTDQQANTPPKTREVLSNALHPGPVDKEHKIAYVKWKVLNCIILWKFWGECTHLIVLKLSAFHRFTTMRVAVVTCKSNTVDANNEPDDEFGEHVCVWEGQWNI